MDKTNITVTMPMCEYEKLQEVEIEYNNLIRIFNRASIVGNNVMSEELVSFIVDINS